MNFLATPGRTRNAIFGAAGLIGFLFVTQVLLPGDGGGRGTPAALLYRGLVLGLLSSLTAAGIMLVYRTLRIINFAQGAIGAAGAGLTFSFMLFTKVPFPAAFALGLALSALVGFTFGLLTLRFARAPRLVLTVFTIVAVQLIITATPFARNLPFFPDVEVVGFFGELAQIDFRDRLPLAGVSYHVGSSSVPFGFAEILAIEISVVCLLALGAFLRYTRTGVATRALAENAERASLMGISSGLLSCVVWSIAGVLSGVGVTLVGTLTGPTVVSDGGFDVLLPALAAAVIARMRILPVAVAAAVALAVLREAWAFSFSDDLALFDVGLLLIVAAGLLIQRRQLQRSEQRSDISSWSGAAEPRPIPAVLRSLGGIRVARWTLIGMGLFGALVYPYTVSTGAVVLGGVIAINTIVVVSLVVLTGWAGQVSLGQFGFVAIGAVVGGSLTAEVGIPFWFAVPIATLVVAAIAMVVGLPALRVPGLFLLVVTFGFAIAVERVLFEPRYFGWLLPGAVERPTLLILDFDDERSMYYLCVAALVLAVVVVASIRRSRLGRILVGVRDNEPNILAFGIPAVRTKLFAFAISGGLAGFAGAIFAHQQRGVSGGSFGAEASIAVFIQAVFGGVSSVGGALLGSGYFNLLKYFTSSPLVIILFGPLTTMVLLLVAPGGVISLLIRVRDGVLKIVAQRRQLVVPSLYTDLDPDVLAQRAWLLAPPLSSGGLAALPPDSRYILPSKVHDQMAEAEQMAAAE